MKRFRFAVMYPYGRGLDQVFIGRNRAEIVKLNYSMALFSRTKKALTVSTNIKNFFSIN